MLTFKQFYLTEMIAPPAHKLWIVDGKIYYNSSSIDHHADIILNEPKLLKILDFDPEEIKNIDKNIVFYSSLGEINEGIRAKLAKHNAVKILLRLNNSDLVYDIFIDFFNTKTTINIKTISEILKKYG